MKQGSFFEKKIKPLLQHKVFSLVLLYIAMVIIFTVWALIHSHENTFFTWPVFRNILNSLVVSSFLTMGAGFLLIAGHIDLSQAAIGAFGSMVLATAIKGWGLPWYVGVVIALCLCAVFGAVNAVLVTRLRFPSFISTLAMASMVKGLMYLFSSLGNKGLAANVNFMNKAVSFIGTGSVGPIPFGVIVMAIFFIVYGLIISKSAFGMKVTLMGGSPVAATLAGINANGIMTILFVNSAVLGGVAGVFNCARLSQGALTALTTNQFTGLTAAILGGISFGGGVGGMGGAFVGLLILNTFQIGMGIVGVNPFWVNVFSGLLLLIALAFDFLSQQRQKKALAH